ncbi:MAG TPA: DNA translocase FtsK [Phycisphaerae bacterium]|nr:DNA translocase FtsK [Phycisphaerae bacterium]HNU45249.1 DNA translocase FtsK [Phycisphaerae bacterium]
MSASTQTTSHGRVLWPVLTVGACALLWPALLTFDIGDWPSPHQFPLNDPPRNACGTVGALAAYCLRYALGDGAYPLLLFATLALVTRLVRGQVGHLWERLIGLALVVPGTAAAVHLVAAPNADSLPVGAGGVLGHVLGQLLARHVSQLGTVIVLGAVLFVGLVFATHGWILRLPRLMRRAGEASGQALAAARERMAERAAALKPAPVAVPAVVAETAVLEPRINPSRPTRKPDRVEPPPPPAEDRTDDRDEATAEDQEDTPRSGGETGAPPVRTEQAPRVRHAGAKRAGHSGGSGRAASAAAHDRVADAGDDGRAESASDAEDDQQTGSGAAPAEALLTVPGADRPPEPYPRELGDWPLPPLSLLDEPEHGFTAEQEAFVREQARILERTLEEFRLDARVVEIDTGPVITMFELKLGAGVKVSQIASLSNDIARALKAHAIRVVAPIPGKNTVGIEVPNSRKEIVRLKELMFMSGPKAARMSLPLFLGKDAAGQALVADLTKMPHLLIAGTTGSGKSVCLNSVIASVLMTQRPDRVKMILVDPKMVELCQFKGMPHLMCPIVTDMARAEKILEWAVTKMEERYELLAEARVRNVADFNALGAEAIYERFQPSNDQERALIPTALPYIVVIIDELADLMMTAAKEVEHHLSRLAQKSRAVGIHIIVATQRPEARVVTGLIKSNLPCRIAFRVSSRIDSRIVLDQNGGEVLMGQGDMLFLPPGVHKLVRAQGTYLEDHEIQAVLDYLAERGGPEFHPELVRLRPDNAEGDPGTRDPLFDQAVRIVLETKRGSVSLLQRRLMVGYSRASRLIDQMADAGLVGDYKGSQAREVLMTLADWDALQKQLAADLQSGYAADQDDEAEDAEVEDVAAAAEAGVAEDPEGDYEEGEEDEEDEEDEDEDDDDEEDEDAAEEEDEEVRRPVPVSHRGHPPTPGRA